MQKINLSLLASALLCTNLYATTTDEIVVYGATKSNQSIQDVTSNVSVISGAELESKNITTLTDALNLASGISFTANGGLGKTQSVRLRGFDSKRVLVLIDGIRYNDPTSTAGAPFEDIILDDIERIEIIKGAQSGIWGADASAGVINIITKGIKEGTHAGVLVERGSFNTQKHGFMVSQNTEKLYIKSNYHKVTTDGFTAYAKKGDDIDSYEDDGYENRTFTLKSGLKIDDNNKVDLQHSLINSENEFDNFGSDSLTNKSSSKTKISKIQYENKDNLKQTDFYFSKTDFFRDFPPYFAKYDGVVDEFGIKSNIAYDTKKSFLVIGVDYKKFHRADVVNKGFDNKGFFITNSNNFDKKIILTESIRYDKNSDFDNKTTGKLGAKYTASKDLAYMGNIGSAYNTPKLGELYGAFGANPNLKPETTKSYDVGVSYKDIKITYFSNKIEDMISYDMTTSSYKNIEGKSKIKGIEAEYLQDISNTILLTINYTALDAKDKDDKELARRAKERLKFAVDYYGIKRLHIGLNGEYVGERFDRADKKGEQTGKYTVANVVINYNLAKGIKTYLKVDNFTDKYYQTVDGYATSPRAYYAGLKYNF